VSPNGTPGRCLNEGDRMPQIKPLNQRMDSEKQRRERAREAALDRKGRMSSAGTPILSEPPETVGGPPGGVESDPKKTTSDHSIGSRRNGTEPARELHSITRNTAQRQIRRSGDETTKKTNPEDPGRPNQTFDPRKSSDEYQPVQKNSETSGTERKMKP
jgi:hypothetical protein